MQVSGLGQFFGLRILRAVESRHRRLIVDDLAGQHLALHFEHASLLDQGTGPRHADPVKLRKLRKPAGFDQRPVRHDAEPLEMRRPVFAEIDVLDVAPTRDRPIQLAIVQSQVLLVEPRLEIGGQRPIEHASRRLRQRDRGGSGELLCLAHLHQIQQPGLFRLLSFRIDPADKQSLRDQGAFLRIVIEPSFPEDLRHLLQRHVVAFRQHLRVSREIFLFRHGTDGHIAWRIEFRIVLDDVVQGRCLRLNRFLLDLEHIPPNADRGSG